MDGKIRVRRREWKKFKKMLGRSGQIKETKERNKFFQGRQKENGGSD